MEHRPANRKNIAFQKREMERNFETDAGWKTAIKNIPDADIAFVQKLEGDGKMSDSQLRKLLVHNRWANPICGNCGDKKQEIPLLRCSGCCLEMYCNKTCQKAHWKTHKLRCKKRSGPLDQGYQALAVIKLAPKSDVLQKPAVTPELIPPPVAEAFKFVHVDISDLTVDTEARYTEVKFPRITHCSDSEFHQIKFEEGKAIHEALEIVDQYLVQPSTKEYCADLLEIEDPERIDGYWTHLNQSKTRGDFLEKCKLTIKKSQNSQLVLYFKPTK